MASGARGAHAQRRDDMSEHARVERSEADTASFEPTQRTTFKRLAYRGTHDRETVYAILDEGFVCHVV